MSWKNILIFYFIILHFITNVYTKDGIIVETKIGRIHGARDTDGEYTMYMGIPYAAVNKSNVFGESIPLPPFQGVFKANDSNVICPQVNPQGIMSFPAVISLNCLRLNIYVPDSTNVKSLLPVMVYLFGGRHVHGHVAKHILYNPNFIVQHGVILVTLNYRLGPYGFMCLHTPNVPGNAGLKDQVQALKWIQTNIESFGGDPQKVTLFGHSSGADCVTLHLVSETEKLYSNIIIQSGRSVLKEIVIDENTRAPLEIAASMNYTTDNINDALSFLSKADIQAVIAASSKVKFGPCLEKKIPGIKRFLANIPMNSNFSKTKGMSLMFGFTSHEGLLWHQSDNLEDYARWPEMFEKVFKSSFNFEESECKKLADIFRRFYIGDNNKEINSEIRRNLIDYWTDFERISPNIRNIPLYFDAGAYKVYQYVFSHEGKRNIYKIMHNITFPGVCHADELGYLFDMSYFSKAPNEQDQLIIDRITTMWTNFAKFSDPTPQITSLLPVKWEPITRGSPYHYLDINVNMTTGSYYQPKRIAFWELFYTAYGKYQKGFKHQNEDIKKAVSTNVTFADILLVIVVLLISSFVFRLCY